MLSGTRNLKIDRMKGLLTPLTNRMKREVPPLHPLGHHRTQNGHTTTSLLLKQGKNGQTHLRHLRRRLKYTKVKTSGATGRAPALLRSSPVGNPG